MIRLGVINTLAAIALVVLVCAAGAWWLNDNNRKDKAAIHRFDTVESEPQTAEPGAITMVTGILAPCILLIRIRGSKSQRRLPQSGEQ